MNDENILQIMQDIAAIKESLKSAHKRIDENDALTTQIHKLAIAIETLTMQVKIQNDRMEAVIAALEERLKAQGIRIGEIEKKPAKQWEAVVKQIVAIIVAAVMAYFIALFNIQA